MKTHVYTISRANTPERGRLLVDTISLGRETAGMDFYWHVYCNAPLAGELVQSLEKTGLINECTIYPHNVGQHVPTNEAITLAIADEAAYLVRADDDVEWITKRWLAKLIENSKALGDRFILSPTVLGLRHPPATTDGEVGGVKIRHLNDPYLGGICRLIPVAKLKEVPYVSDVRLPMGLGDASGVGKWGRENLIFMAYTNQIRVRHAKGTKGQEQEDAAHFDEHVVLQHCPYIPAWNQPCA